MEVYGKDHKPLSINQILEQLKQIVERSQKPSVPVGILTTENRNTWAKAYNNLIKGKLSTWAKANNNLIKG